MKTIVYRYFNFNTKNQYGNYGLKNIRVIDASIMPTMLSANLHSGATLIGEKGSDLVLGNNPIDPVILNY